jgi:hypothetical protein
MAHKTWAGILLALWLSGTPATHAANKGPKKLSAKEKLDWEAFQASGREHFERGEYEEALAEYNHAYLLDADLLLLFNIAKCQHKLGRINDAELTYTLILSKTDDKELQALAQAALTQLADEKQNPTRAKNPNARPTSAFGLFGIFTGQPILHRNVSLQPDNDAALPPTNFAVTSARGFTLSSEFSPDARNRQQREPRWLIDASHTSLFPTSVVAGEEIDSLVIEDSLGVNLRLPLGPFRLAARAGLSLYHFRFEFNNAQQNAGLDASLAAQGLANTTEIFSSESVALQLPLRRKDRLLFTGLAYEHVFSAGRAATETLGGIDKRVGGRIEAGFRLRFARLFVAQLSGLARVHRTTFEGGGVAFNGAPSVSTESRLGVTVSVGYLAP